jgi:hypothetical protein
LLQINFISPSGTVTSSIELKLPQHHQKNLKSSEAFEIIRNDILAGKPTELFAHALETVSCKHLKSA